MKQLDEAILLRHALGRVLATARSAGLTRYDAAHLDLAARHGLPLATSDDHLARAARATGVELLEA